MWIVFVGFVRGSGRIGLRGDEADRGIVDASFAFVVVLFNRSFRWGALFGFGFHVGTRYGAAILACISALAVIGTGMLRPGTVRGPGFAFAAL